MFADKILVEIYVVNLDRNYEIYIPVNEKIGNILWLIYKAMYKDKNNQKKAVFLNAFSGNIYKNNDIVRNTDIKNGTKLIMI